MICGERVVVGMAGALGWALGSTAGRVLRGCRDGWWSGQAGCGVCGRSQAEAVARSPSSALWRGQAVSEVAGAVRCGQAASWP